MAHNPIRPKGLSERAKPDVNKKITSLIFECLKSLVSKVSENDESARFRTYNEILPALPECHNLIKRVTRMGWVNQVFSETFVEATVTSTIFEIVKNSDSSNLGENVPKYVDQMITNLTDYNRSHVVYVPLEGLKLAKGLGELQFGDASVVQMSDEMLSQPREVIKKLRDQKEKLRKRYEEYVILRHELGETLKAVKNAAALLDLEIKSEFKEKKVSIDDLKAVDAKRARIVSEDGGTPEEIRTRKDPEAIPKTWKAKNSYDRRICRGNRKGLYESQKYD